MYLIDEASVVAKVTEIWAGRVCIAHDKFIKVWIGSGTVHQIFEGNIVVGEILKVGVLKRI